MEIPTDLSNYAHQDVSLNLVSATKNTCKTEYNTCIVNRVIDPRILSGRRNLLFFGHGIWEANEWLLLLGYNEMEKPLSVTSRIV